MKKIVLIEDEINIRRNTKVILENSGFDVFDAPSGEDGLALINKIIPDIIVCDIMLPGISGYQVLSASLNNDATVNIPFIFLSAKSEIKDVRKGMELGADDYLQKPFNSNDLLKAIETRLNKKNKINNLNSSVNRNVTHIEDIKYKGLENTDHILTVINNKNVAIRFREIVLISAEREYSKIYLSNGSTFTTCRVLKRWESILPSETFLRIHRSKIINTSFIEKIEKYCKRSLIVYFKKINETAVISQRYAARIKRNYNLGLS